jgi:hypothetical protein
MMEAPDSPPELSYATLANQSFSAQTPSSSQQSNSGRVNGEANAKVNHGAPGSSWQTKKFTEEYERAQNALLDQNWDHGEFASCGGRDVTRLTVFQRDMAIL